MEKYIILVATACVAHLYNMEFTKSSTARLIKTIVHPDSRKKNMDLIADKPGRAQADYCSQKITFGVKTEPKVVEKEKFITQISYELTQVINDNPQIQIILIAEPELMGKINKLLPHYISTNVKYRINKNLTFLNENELTKILKTEIKPHLIISDNQL